MLYVTSIKVDGKEQLIGELLASFFASDAQLHMDVVKEGGTVEVRFCNRGGRTSVSRTMYTVRSVQRRVISMEF